MAATLLPMARAVFYDANGNPLSGGFVHTYVPGGTVAKTTWQDAAEVTPNANPITLDAAGSCLLYGAGDYQITVTDSLGNSIAAYSGLSEDTGTPLTTFETNLASITDATKGSALVGYFQTWTGFIGRTIEARLGDVVSVLDFGADNTGVADCTAKIQAAINRVQLTGGGIVYVPPGTYKVTGTLNITSAGVVLQGASQYGCTINFANGASDGIKIGYQGGVVYGAMVRDLSLAGVSKTGGIIINAKNIGNMQVANCIISGAYNGVYVELLNNVLFFNVTIILGVAGGAYGMKWYSTATALAASNVLALQQVTIQCSATGADGLVIDGNCQTLRCQAVGIIHATHGLRIQNTQLSAQYYPQFIFCDDLEIDGVTAQCVRIEGGRHIRFSNCDFFNNFAGGGADDNCIYILSDGTHSVTSAIWLSACRISGAQQNGVVCYAKNVNIIGCYIGDNALASSGAGAGVNLLNDGGTNGAATSITITGGQIGAAFGDVGQQSYGVACGSGVTRVTVANCDFSNCVTAAFNDSTGGLGNLQWHGCINIDGTELPDRVPILPGDFGTTEGVFYENAATHALKIVLNGVLKTVTVT